MLDKNAKCGQKFTVFAVSGCYTADVNGRPETIADKSELLPGHYFMGKGADKMAKERLHRMLALLLSFSMAVGLMGGTALAAEGEEEGGGSPEVTEPAPAEELPQVVTFDISLGAVTAGAAGVTGVPVGETEAVTVSWEDAAGRELVVTGTSTTTADVITMAADCPQDLALTLDNVDITSEDLVVTPRTQAAISIQTAEARTLTLTLKGENYLHATAGRLLWTQNGSMMRFVGQDTDGEMATLELADDETGISLLYGGETGMFEFENCHVTMAGRDLDDTNQVLSKGTKVYLGENVSITDGTGETVDSGTIREVVHDISAGDVTISRQDTVACGVGWLVYRSGTAVRHIITGTSTSGRVTVTFPGAMVVLKDLTITTTDRSAFLVKYADSADSGEMLTVQISGKVNLQTSTASTFNTNEAEKGAVLVPVTAEGITEDAELNITRTGEGDATGKAAVGVDLTLKNLDCSISQNCLGDITADAGSVVFVGGEIGGEATEREDGLLIRGTFGYRFVVDGRVFKPVADASNGNASTLLLPGDADLCSVAMEGTPGWTVTYGDVSDNSGTVVLDFASAENNTLTIMVTPPEQAGALGAVGKELTLRAMKSSEDIPALYLSISPDSEKTMAQVEADYNHDTKATGTAVLLGDDSLPEMEMEVKGRGNASWHRAKKGFQVKLDKKTDVMGMGKAKKWVLLPSAADLSLIRNSVALDLAQQLELDYTSEWRFVDLYVDGAYYGLYILCEKPEIGDNRVEITNMDDAIENAIGKEDASGNDKLLSGEPGVTYSEDHSTATMADGTVIDLTGGYHLEFDNYDDVLQFGAGAIKHITVKEPERLGSNAATDESFTYIRDFMARADAAVTDYSNDEELLKYIDLESFAKMWLLQEYTAGHDATDNLHIWKDSNVTGDGLIHAGPAWDFDNIMARDEDFANVVKAAQKQRITDAHADYEPQDNPSAADYNARWLAQLMRHKVFQEEVTRQCEKYKNLFTCCENCTCASAADFAGLAACDNCGGCYVHNTAASQWEFVQDSIAMDTVRWYNYNFVSTSLKKPVQPYYREQSARNIMLFACVRNGYLAERIAQWGAELYDVTFVSGGKTVAALRAGSTGLQTLPVVERAGYTFEGWFYTEDGEGKAFTAGTPVTGEMTVTAKWTLNDDLTVTIGQGVVDKVYDGQSAILSVTASISAEDAVYTYQWYRMDGETPVQVDGANSASYPVVNVADSGTYFCRVTAAVDGETLSRDSGEMTVSILPKSLDADAVEDVPDQTYTGSAITPALNVVDGGTVLTEGMDYTAAYTNNVQTGTAQVTVAFQGNYTGTAVKTFIIVKKAPVTPPGPGGGNGNAGHPVKDETEKDAHGTITIAPKQAKKGKTVNIIPKPDKGYEVDTITVLDDAGKQLTVTKKNGHYSFTMPDCTVTVKASFRKTDRKLPFADVKPGEWFYEAIVYAYEHGLMKGIGDTAFGPGGITTRGMVATILWNLEGCPSAAGEAFFSDVPEDAYCAQAVKWASENGIVTGYGNGRFGPGDPVKREQMAAILFNYARFKGHNVSGDKGVDVSSFKDISELSTYAGPAMQWCVDNGIIAGKGGGILDPKGKVTRSQAAQMFYSFCENVAG